MTKGVIHIISEPVDPWQALTCVGCCLKPPIEQQTACCGGERLPEASAPHCGSPYCRHAAGLVAIQMAKQLPILGPATTFY